MDYTLSAFAQATMATFLSQEMGELRIEATVEFHLDLCRSSHTFSIDSFSIPDSVGSGMVWRVCFSFLNSGVFMMLSIEYVLFVRCSWDDMMVFWDRIGSMASSL
jgi:hypothetical protein